MQRHRLRGGIVSAAADRDVPLVAHPEPANLPGPHEVLVGRILKSASASF